MMGGRLRTPNELLHSNNVTQVGAFAEYHRALVSDMSKATEAAKEALAKDQRCRAKYYNRRVSVADLVWVLQPPRRIGITKLAHQWLGPARIVEGADFDNWKVRREDTGEHMVVHSSFLVSSSCPSDSLGSVAERIPRKLEEEDNEVSAAEAGDGRDETETGHDGAVDAAVPGSDVVPRLEENTADAGGPSAQAAVETGLADRRCRQRFLLDIPIPGRDRRTV
ncbi:Hypothetical protein PHPALM_15999 [Phytophthora palmivora]|uniref:Uncharacterized protein n=1 Tax=Phytophthora palmivora TaxID=4796 RepID=A0A2P4XQQ9_9STRA|nr:Hypothetical protein PHPALM_15999 [Phytophthora palmivora]